MRLLFDLETDNLYENVTRIWLIVAMDIDTKQIRCFSDQDSELESLQAGLEYLSSADTLLGHNIIGYDIPVIRKLYKDIELSFDHIDTLNLSRLAYPSFAEIDFALAKKGQLPKNLINKHSLAAWGHRLRMWKGDYSDWSKYTKEMLEYCQRDVKLTFAVYNKCMSEINAGESVEIEMEFQKIIQIQETLGVPFNVELAKEMARELERTKGTVTEEIRAIVPTHTTYKTIIPRRNNAEKGYIQGVPFQKETVSEFNPGSRQQIISFLQQKYAWEPTVFTDNDNPSLDSDVLEGLSYPEAKLFQRYFETTKLLGQLSAGPQSWLKHVNNGIIRGRMITNGTITGRCTHHSPNLGQIPSVDSFMGKEVRALFYAPSGYNLVGCDASKLELVCLAHYLAPYDNGDYARIVESGDVHEKNRLAAGLDTRSVAKRYIYAFLYGAGDEMLGSIIAPDADKRTREIIGAKSRRSLYQQIPALQKLSEAVKVAFAARGHIFSLDGRKIKPRSAHTALNSLLQSAGAVLMKKATILKWDHILNEELHAAPALHVHDEYQDIVREDHAKRVGELGVKAIEESGAHFKLKCFLTGEYKIGNNWAETH